MTTVRREDIPVQRGTSRLRKVYSAPVKVPWLLACVLVASAGAHAQDVGSTNEEASDRVATGDVVRNRQAAAQAYDRAASLYVAGQYAQAGQWFMSAYRLAPARAALVQAVRSYQRAGELARAGTLALLLGEAYPNDAGATALVSEVVEEAGRSSALLTVQCAGCIIEVDGRLLATRGAYLTPDERHVVVAYFGDIRVERSAVGARGEQLLIELEVPEGATTVDGEETGSTVPPLTTRDRGVRVLPPAVFWTGVGLTAALGGVTLWSGVDTVSGVDAYEANPSEERYQDGQRKERRTNALLGATAGMALVAIVSALFTDFEGDPEDAASASVGVSPSIDGAIFYVRGRL